MVTLQKLISRALKTISLNGMGVRGLMSYCKRIQTYADMNKKDLHIGIDAFSLFFLFQERRADFYDHLKTLRAKHKIDFIMDKRAAKEKKEVVEKRKAVRKEAAVAVEVARETLTTELDDQQRAVLEKYLTLKLRDSWCIYPDYMKWLRSVIAELDIKLVIAAEEADSELARGYDVVITSDSDLLILGAKCVWIPRGVGIQHNEILQKNFLKLIGLQGEQLFEIAFLAGCDVQPRKLVDLHTGVSLLRFYGSLEKIHERLPATVSEEQIGQYKKLRESVWSK